MWEQLTAVIVMAFICLPLVVGLLYIFGHKWFPPRRDNQQRILFYDGECGLCAHSVRFFMKADRAKILQYAPLQGNHAAQHLPEDLRDTSDLSTVVYFENDESLQTIHVRSQAVCFALIDIGGLWRVAGGILRLLPTALREPCYRLIAKHRMKLFPTGACELPTEDERARLLD